jgi:hypothetical protein
MEIVIKGRIVFPLLLQHQPHHYQLMVEVLSRTHHFHLFALLQTHLVHLQDLGHEGTRHLPARLTVQEVSHIGVYIRKQ